MFAAHAGRIIDEFGVYAGRQRIGNDYYVGYQYEYHRHFNRHSLAIVIQMTRLSSSIDITFIFRCQWLHDARLDRVVALSALL